MSLCRIRARSRLEAGLSETFAPHWKQSSGRDYLTKWSQLTFRYLSRRVEGELHPRRYWKDIAELSLKDPDPPTSEEDLVWEAGSSLHGDTSSDSTDYNNQDY